MATTRTTKKPTKKPTAKTPAKSAAGRMSLDEVMRTLEKAGSAQTKKTYARHGAKEPMFGVLFGTLKVLVDRIGIDQEFALELWSTKNQDARNLAMKIADPAKIKSADLDRWAKENTMRMCGMYIASLAAESPFAAAKVRDWLASSDEELRATGWTLIAQLANLDEKSPDDWFAKRLAQIEKTIHSSSSVERGAMNAAVIAIGGRSAALRKLATAAAKRIGPVEVDHGDTACTTPDAVTYINKLWERAKKFDSPAAAERARESMRTRC
jgi:3-methyladenine DNA glycosylase AlkD